MKSPWLWIVGIVVAVWIFLPEKHGDSLTKSTFIPPAQINFQPQPTYLQQATSIYSSPTFMGNSCTDDCSGHLAGYRWAEENGIDDPDDCGGNSNSFIEGCQSFAEEQQEKAEEEATADDE